MTEDLLLSRRTLLRTGGTVAFAGLLAGCAGAGGSREQGTGTTAEPTPETETTAGEVTTTETETGTTGAGTDSSTTSGGASSADLESWFEDVGNYQEMTDMTGESTVEIAVGAEGNNGCYAYEPPGARISTGTTVVWEWTGRGASHDVVASEGSFESNLTSEQGHTFEHTFESKGVYKYYCTPHRAMGMKGALVVE
jgi:halocyanin-like protein